MLKELLEKIISSCLTRETKEVKEINCKIVYYGVGLSGRTTNMQYIHDTLKTNSKTKITSIATETERALFFSFIPLDIKPINWYKIRFHLYSRPGPYFYNDNDLPVLKDVDGIVFVADSQIERMDANQESLWNLEHNLKLQGYDLMTIPYVLQLNKRDLPNALPIEELKKELMRKNEQVIEAIAYKGIGVYETFNCIALQVWQQIKDDKPLIKS